MKYLVIILLFFSQKAHSQLTSFIWHGDTLWCKNPSTGDSTQISNKPVPWTSVTTKPTTASGWLSDVPTTAVTVNGHPLSANVTVTASDVGLGNVTNESKSTMFTSPTFTGTVSGVTSSMVGLGSVTNESKATMFTNAVFTGTFTAPNSTVTNAMLAGSIDLTTKVINALPFANGGIGTAAATSATTGTMTVNMTTEIITITPTGACTFNASGGVTGQRVTFIITTSGVSSFTLTWGTNYKTTATLATGTTTAKKFCVTFLYDGTIWIETNRTAAQ